MFLSIFKEKTLNERLERFFTRLESGKLKNDQNGKTVWAFDAIEIKIEEGFHETRCYFTIDYRAIYVFRFIKEMSVSEIIIEREDYLHEKGYLEKEALKKKITSFIEKMSEKNPC